MNTTLKTSILSAVFATSLSMGAFYIFPGLLPDKGNTIKIEHLDGTPASKALFTMNNKGEVTPLDFTKVSGKVLDGVVHIKSSVIQQPVAQRGIPQMQQDFFRQFFGPNFRMQPPQGQANPQAQVSTGSGVIISNEGYIVTNNHVIDKADDVEVTLHDNRVFKAKVVGTDPTTDLAVLQIEAEELTTIPFVDSEEVQVGEWVLAAGNPFSLNSTITAGIVSAKGRSINILREKYAIENFIQTDAAINPGNSGGALVNLQGGLIGINTAIASPTGSYSGYGFAVPSNIVEKVVEDLINYGMVQRAILGVSIRSVDGNLAKEKGISINQGVYVEEVMEGSSADKANVEKGDVIVAINGKTVNTVSDLQGEIAQQRPGDDIEVIVNRTGTEQALSVKLSGENGSMGIIKREILGAEKLLGATFEELDDDTAAKLGIAGGVRVTSLTAGKLRRETQMQDGFIITKIDKKPIRSIESLQSALDNREGGILIEGVYEGVRGRYFYGVGLD